MQGNSTPAQPYIFKNISSVLAKCNTSRILSVILIVVQRSSALANSEEEKKRAVQR